MLLASLNRLALIGCLLAIITALILPRRHNLARILQDILPDVLLAQLRLIPVAICDEQQTDRDSSPRSRLQDIIREQSSNSGPTLRHKVGSAEFRKKSSSSAAHAYFVPTPESTLHSQARSRLPNQLTEPDWHGLGQRLAPTGQPTISLTVFTVIVIALILYTAMRMFTTRSGQRPPKGFPIGNQSHFCQSNSAQDIHNDRASGSRCGGKPDMRPMRKMAKLSRDERARELIMHHGAKNVSQAIKFLTVELEKQRHELGMKNLSRDSTGDVLSPACSCTCHHHHNSNLAPTGHCP